jgi:aryl-alcohol dehydrogenase-like predicted oxidoreductase
MQGARGNFKGGFTEKDYDIIDALAKIATEHQTDVPTIALAYVFAKDGISSTIIGARTLEHLESNLKAVDIRLTPEQIKELDQVSKPVLNFPADFNMNNSPNFSGAGVTVNGRKTERPGNFPRKDDLKY